MRSKTEEYELCKQHNSTTLKHKRKRNKRRLTDTQTDTESVVNCVHLQWFVFPTPDIHSQQHFMAVYTQQTDTMQNKKEKRDVPYSNNRQHDIPLRGRFQADSLAITCMTSSGPCLPLLASPYFISAIGDSVVALQLAWDTSYPPSAFSRCLPAAVGITYTLRNKTTVWTRWRADSDKPPKAPKGQEEVTITV